MARLRIIVPISIFLIFLLLFNAFGSVKSALLILSNIPFALVGGILALLVTRIPLRKRDKITWSLWTWRDTVVPLAVKFRLLDHEFR